MILKNTLKNIIIAQQLDIHNKNLGLIRDKIRNIPTNSDQAITISGVRRCGKSTLLRQLLKDIEQVNYLNFEDPLLSAFEITDYDILIEIFSEINPGSKTYFFDEIQNVSNWEQMARTMLDKNNKLFIAGSNSALLSKELGSKLTGRHLRFELYPFSYNEYLRFFKEKASAETLSEYIIYGGFPQYLKEKNPLLLKELLIDILNRDIVVRYNIKSVRVIRELLIYLLSNTSKPQTYNSLAKLFSVKSVNTIKNYMQYFEDAYLMISIPQATYSIKKQIVNPKKIYCIDTGLAISNGISFSENKGNLLENAILIELKRRSKEIYYHKNNKECDFVIKEGTKIIEAIQVCHELNRENQDREINGIMEAIEQFKLNEGTIITFDQEDTIIKDKMKIKVIPAWKWMQEKSIKSKN